MQRIRYNTQPPWQRAYKRMGPALALRTRQKYLHELPTVMKYIIGKPYNRALADFVSGQLMFYVHWWHPDVYQTAIMNNFGEIHFIVKDGIIIDIKDVPYDYYFGTIMHKEGDKWIELPSRLHL